MYIKSVAIKMQTRIPFLLHSYTCRC